MIERPSRRRDRLVDLFAAGTVDLSDLFLGRGIDDLEDIALARY